MISWGLWQFRLVKYYNLPRLISGITIDGLGFATWLAPDDSREMFTFRRLPWVPGRNWRSGDTSWFPGDPWLKNPWENPNLWMMFRNPRNMAFNIGHYVNNAFFMPWPSGNDYQFANWIFFAILRTVVNCRTISGPCSALMIPSDVDSQFPPHDSWPWSMDFDT